jgi:hypothetical protein
MSLTPHLFPPSSTTPINHLSLFLPPECLALLYFAVSYCAGLDLLQLEPLLTILTVVPLDG